MNRTKDKSIILFDGVWNLCNASVNFIIKNDEKQTFLFASLQSDAAKEILLQFSSRKIDFKSILLIKNGIIYDKSTAVLLITKQLSNYYKFLYGLIIIPAFMRDFVYNFIAKHRYNWFGKEESCMIPSASLKNRFL